MKLLITTAALVLAGVPALAQTAAPAPVPASSATPAATAAPSTNTPIETLMAKPATKAAVLKTFDKLDENPAYDQFKALSLRQLAQMLGGAIPTEKLDQVDKDLAAIK